MSAFQFELKGPFPLLPHKENSICNQNCEGVYLWCINSNGSYYINYVGISGNIGYRHIEHLKSYLTGAYTLYQPVRFSQIQKEMIYQPQKDQFLSKFLEKFDTIKDSILKQLELFEIFYIKLSEDEIKLKMIETAIIEHIRQTEWKDFLDNERVEYPIKKDMTFDFTLSSKFYIKGIYEKTIRYSYPK